MCADPFSDHKSSYRASNRRIFQEIDSTYLKILIHFLVLEQLCFLGFQKFQIFLTFKDFWVESRNRSQSGSREMESQMNRIPMNLHIQS